VKRSLPVVATLLAGSGFCALVYQTAWMRQFRLIFGASTFATAAVLAIFMGGLGLGSALLGRRADRHPNPLRLYGNLELLIALSAALSQPLLWLVGKVYIALGGSVTMGTFGATIVRLILASLVLAIPTILMGGTLPAAARAVTTSDDAGRRRLALLYGINTLGAVIGALASTFFMLETFGNQKTLIIAVLLNLLVAMIARSMRTADVSSAPIEETSSSLPAPFVYASAAIAGFAFLLMELVWYRMLGPLLGGTTFTFGLILAMALLGIALGGTAYSLWSGGGAATVSGFALTCTLEAALLMLPYALGDRIAVLANYLRVLGHAGFGGFIFGWTIITAIVVLPAAIIAGVQFPLLIALLGRGREGIGEHVGRAYAWNTLGAIAGSLAGGFGFLPLFSAPGCWLIAAMLLVAIGLGAAFYARSIPSIAIAACAVAFAFALGPTALWRHSGIGAGRGEMPQNPNEIRSWTNFTRRTTTWDADGRESAVALADADDRSFIVNGKSDGSARADSGTQVMGGLVGAMLHPDPRNALVIGLGTGSTAGWLGAVPSMERVQVVELEPVVLRVAQACAAVNHDVLHNPKVHISIGDAREVLLASRDRYDIVFSEPSNPYRAGIASLFTRDFYEAVRARLDGDGIFLQWVQAYGIDAETMRTIYATIGAVFPRVTTWRTGEGDLLIVATNQPITYDVERIRQRVAMEPYRSALHATWRVESAEGFLAHFLAGDRLTRVVAHDALLNTDDQTPIEFGFARNLGDSGRFHMDQVISLAQGLGCAKPERINGAIDWHAVMLQRAKETDITPATAIAGADERAHHEFALMWDKSNFNAAMQAWTRGGRWSPVNSAEAAMVAESIVYSGSAEDPAPYLAMLRAWEPFEADVIEAALAIRKGDRAAAAALLRRAFAGYRQTAWPQPEIMGRGLALAKSVDAPMEMYAELEQPFAAAQLNEVRLRTLYDLARQLDHCGPRTLAVLKQHEPWAPWDFALLRGRAECYSRAGLHDLAAAARKDLSDYQANMPEALAR
jgi:spermidine synthase